MSVTKEVRKRKVDVAYLVRVYRMTASAIRRLNQRRTNETFKALKMHGDVLKETENTLKTGRKKKLAGLLVREANLLSGQEQGSTFVAVRDKINKEVQSKPRSSR